LRFNASSNFLIKIYQFNISFTQPFHKKSQLCFIKVRIISPTR
jgi:hypothetical protein